ncbi:glycosyltransferase family 4 protein [Guptibacillus algicola]|uniref:glycosyltransferase family 4 protein n=1 Tax=Guptibacillus algicola TaxID=225844 RepID=UPI001CD28331|nr:glycosyltransferase family 4 protein [Alkalihalobacillus algicola]MCA0986864.1 glycosyltransferase family 4 protein [Alkalihalobacillus algicola]
MKVCHLTSVHSPNDIRIFIKECRSLQKAGYDVSYVVPNTTSFVKDGVNIIGVASEATNERNRMVNTTKKVYEAALKVDADIYHFHDPELIPIGLKLKRKGKKVVHDIHEDVPRQILEKQWIPKYLRKSISVVFERYEHYAAKKFDAVITATPYICERFKRIGSNAYNVNNYPILSELYMDDSDWNQKKSAVCFIGGITKVRAASEMVEAIGKTDSLLILGGNIAPVALRQDLEENIGWKNVRDMGFVDRETVASVMSESLAGLVLYHPLPNHINAQPNKMFEYMSAGIPVIGSNFKLWEDIIKGNDCGLCVDPLNPDEIAKAIEWITNNPQKAQEMGKNGREAIEQKYNWEKESETLIDIYQNI